MKRETFTDIEYGFHKRKTKREDFLKIIDETIPGEARRKELYIQEKALGGCNIKLPYRVPEYKEFVLADHRPAPADLRKAAAGDAARKQLAGSVLCRVCPLNVFGSLEQKGE